MNLFYRWRKSAAFPEDREPEQRLLVRVERPENRILHLRRLYAHRWNGC
jgi:hypothetical protein